MTLNSFSLMLSTCPEESLRDAGRALSLADKAQEQTGEVPYTLNARATALALQGEFDDATALMEKALKDENFAADEDLDGGSRAKERLAAWKQKKHLSHQVSAP